jgi:hypothetical protein
MWAEGEEEMSSFSFGDNASNCLGTRAAPESNVAALVGSFTHAPSLFMDFPQPY